MHVPGLAATALIIVSLAWVGVASPILPQADPLLVTAGNPDDIRYQRLPGRGYDGIGSLFFSRGNSDAFCTGSLLGSGRHVLTAAHCVTDQSGALNAVFGQMTFLRPGGDAETASIVKYAVHPDWNGDLCAGNDLAVLTLAASASPEIQRYSIYSGADDLGQIAELVGFGFTGTGATGYDIQDDTRRGGLNRLDSTFVNTLDQFPGWTAGANVLLIDFDDGSSVRDALRPFGYADRGTGADEVLPAPGDSGAPALLGGRIAATASFGTRLVRRDGSTSDIDMQANRSFGEVSGLTRMSRYADWVSANAVAIPEPGSGMIAGIVLVVFALLRLRAARTSTVAVRRVDPADQDQFGPVAC